MGSCCCSKDGPSEDAGPSCGGVRDPSVGGHGLHSLSWGLGLAFAIYSATRACEDEDVEIVQSLAPLVPRGVGTKRGRPSRQGPASLPAAPFPILHLGGIPSISSPRRGIQPRRGMLWELAPHSLWQWRLLHTVARPRAHNGIGPLPRPARSPLGWQSNTGIGHVASSPCLPRKQR